MTRTAPSFLPACSDTLRKPREVRQGRMRIDLGGAAAGSPEISFRGVAGFSVVGYTAHIVTWGQDRR